MVPGHTSNCGTLFLCSSEMCAYLLEHKQHSLACPANTYSSKGHSHPHLGLSICDLIRTVVNARSEQHSGDISLRDYKCVEKGFIYIKHIHCVVPFLHFLEAYPGCF